MRAHHPGEAPERRRVKRGGAARPQNPASGASYTLTLKSRSASFRLVFVSVDDLRSPMISAHGTWYVPAGKVFGYIPGMTTLRAGTRPLYSKKACDHLMFSVISGTAEGGAEGPVTEVRVRVTLSRMASLLIEVIPMPGVVGVWDVDVGSFCVGAMARMSMLVGPPCSRHFMPPG